MQHSNEKPRFGNPPIGTDNQNQASMFNPIFEASAYQSITQPRIGTNRYAETQNVSPIPSSLRYLVGETNRCIPILYAKRYSIEVVILISAIPPSSKCFSWRSTTTQTHKQKKLHGLSPTSTVAYENPLGPCTCCNSQAAPNTCKAISFVILGGVATSPFFTATAGNLVDTSPLRKMRLLSTRPSGFASSIIRSSILVRLPRM